MGEVKGASTGGAASTPALFGDYEMGRSKHEKDVRTAVFLDQMKQGVLGFFGLPPGQQEASWRIAANAGVVRKTTASTLGIMHDMKLTPLYECPSVLIPHGQTVL